MRWFIGGELPDTLVPQDRGRRRTDAYHTPTLSAHTALKWRGGERRLECKQRVGRVELATWCGVPGFVECWVKQRIPWQHRPTDAAWREVSKEVWEADGFEIGRAVIEHDIVWTLCVDVDRVTGAARHSVEGLRPVLLSAEPNSFAGFLSLRTTCGAPHALAC